MNKSCSNWFQIGPDLVDYRPPSVYLFCLLLFVCKTAVSSTFTKLLANEVILWGQDIPKQRSYSSQCLKVDTQSCKCGHSHQLKQIVAFRIPQLSHLRIILCTVNLKKNCGKILHKSNLQTTTYCTMISVWHAFFVCLSTARNFSQQCDADQILSIHSFLISSVDNLHRLLHFSSQERCISLNSRPILGGIKRSLT